MNNTYKEMKKNIVKYQKEEYYPLPELPEFIIHEILARIPCEYLYSTFRLVCKSWYNEISSSEFNAQLAKRSKIELLIQSASTNRAKYSVYCKATSLEMDEKELNFNLNGFGMCRMGMIRSSCNGLILVNDPKIKGVQYVMNVVTKCKVAILKCPSGCPHISCGSALGYVPSTKEYKVVHIYADGFGFEIFTLGCPNNAWKRIPGPFKEQNVRPYNIEKFSWSDPVSINGQVFHWHVDSDTFIISLNVSDEISSKTYLPNCENKMQKHKYALVEMDGNLSLVYNVTEFQLDVWVLDDFRKQVWIKKHSITSESINYTSSKCSSSSNKYDNALPNFSRLDPVASCGMVKYSSLGTRPPVQMIDYICMTSSKGS